jgi:hypothetical protein
MQRKDSELLVWLEMLRVTEASQTDQAWEYMVSMVPGIGSRLVMAVNA